MYAVIRIRTFKSIAPIITVESVHSGVNIAYASAAAFNCSLSKEANESAYVAKFLDEPKLHG